MTKKVILFLALATVILAGTAFAQPAGNLIHCDNPGSHSGDDGGGGEPHTQIHEGPHVSAHGEVGDSGVASYDGGLFQVGCSPDIVLFNTTKPAKCTASVQCRGGGSLRCSTTSSSGRAQAGLREENGIAFVYIQCGEEDNYGNVSLTASNQCTP